MSKEQNVLIVGSGGREDALAWKLRQSPWVGKIFVASGNGGTGRFADTYPLVLNSKNPAEVVQAAKDIKAELVVIGPEDPLILGVADHLRGENIPVFGPGVAGAKLEGSKVDAVLFMEKYGVPHPQSMIFNSYLAAGDFLKQPSWTIKSSGWVVKADGPAAGKGAFVCQTREEAEEALERIMLKEEFGQSGKRVIIQEKLQGFEVSAMVLVSREKYIILPYSEDHKQIDDEDRGPNTGGMGVVAPHSLVTPQLARAIEKAIIKPTISGLKREGIDFRGVLYPGIMVTSSGPKVLEYNVRFGDPETEALMPLLDIDLFSVLENASKLRITSSGNLLTNKKHCVVVTLASAGYPQTYEKGKSIYGLPTMENGDEVIVFHAGTSCNESGGYKTAGGRVLMVAGVGKDIEEARNAAYGSIGEQAIHFAGMQFRHDIGSRKRS